MKHEILKTLASQAGFDVDTLCSPYPGGFPKEDMLVLDAFAELILQKCELAIKSVPTHYEAQDKIILECLKSVREAFRS